MSKPRLGVDFRLYGIDDRGLGRYAIALASILSRLHESYELVAFVHPRRSSSELRERGFEIISAPFLPYSLSEQILFPGVIRRARIDYMYYPHFNAPVFGRGPFLLTIHDLILHHFPSRLASTKGVFQYWAKYCMYRVVLFCNIARATKVVCVSSATREDVELQYPRAASKIVTISEGQTLLDGVGENDRNVVLSYTIPRPFLLVVGAFYPHKNIRRFLRVWEQAAADEFDVVLVGKKDQFSAPIEREYQDDARVHFLGGVSDVELVELYRRAAYVVSPSLWEGAGLPGLEALSLGARVISSDAAALAESYGDAACYVAADTDQAFSTGLKRCFRRDRWPGRGPQPTHDEFFQQVHSLLASVITQRHD